MKAITIYQPWASLLANGAKKYETRSWETDYRGEIAIHAAATNIKKILYDTTGKFYIAATKALNNPKLVDLPYGCIIATAEIVGCYEIVSVSNSSFVPRGCKLIAFRDYKLKLEGNNRVFPITENELLFGDFTHCRYAWEFKNMKLLDKPIQAKGKQRLWEWNEDMKG